MATIEAGPQTDDKPKIRCVSRKDFTKEWTFPMHPLHDFELDGEVAKYAPGHPRQWGDETHWLDISKAIRDGQSENAHESFYAAISHDHTLLAIVSGHERILIYHIESQELRQVLDGAGHLIFAPVSVSLDNADHDGPTPTYTLGCNATDKGRRSGLNNQLVFWELDEQGRLMDQEEPIDASAFATQAIDAILPDLAKKHELSEEFVTASSLHAGFAKALTAVATTHRRRHNTTFDDAGFGGFGSTSFSSSGRIFLYHTKNRSTQSGVRPPEELPHVVVMDIVNGKELYRLSGHTDAIMWSAISPNDEHIASIAWDGTLRMYSAETGKLEWSTSGGGQAWTGAFSADSKHIVWSTANGQAIIVHDVRDGRGRSSFPEKFRDWCRNVAWHPHGNQIALCAGQHAYVWRPFDGNQGKIMQHYQMEDDKDGRSMASVQDIDWLDNGRLLHLYFSDGTNLVYDTQSNTKELFMHPKGVDNAWTENGFHGDIKLTGIGDGYISVDGDAKVRYWSSGEPTPTSWWDNALAQKAKKTPFPETGKYVMVSKRPGKGKLEQQDQIVGGSLAREGTELATG
jgi:WD40 repeat protein